MIVLADRDNVNEVIEEEKQEWVVKVLVALGVEESILEINDPMFDISDYLAGLNLEIWNNPNGTVDILRGDKVVGQWKEPSYILKKEGQGKFYYEVKINEWSLPFQMEKRGRK